jgi:hypothetical protein
VDTFDRMRRSTGALGLLCWSLLGGCSSRGRADAADVIERGVDAGITSPAELAPLLTPGAPATSPSGREARVKGAGLVARLPALASGPLALRAESGAHLATITALDVAGSPAIAHDDRLEYRDVAPATDLRLVHSGATLEELRVLRDATAPRTLRWRIELGEGIASLRVRERYVELVDGNGRVALSAAPMFLIDARGEERAITPRISGRAGDELIAELPLDGVTYPVVVDPAWSTVASLPTTLFFPMGVQLPTGKVLVAGGQHAGTDVTSAELYDLALNTWSATGSLIKTRSGGTTLMPPSGNPVITGYTSPDAPPEQYDVASGTFSLVAGMANDRFVESVTLGDGRLVLAGWYGAYLWTEGSAVEGPFSYPGGRTQAAIAKLPGDKALFAGGSAYPSLSTAVTVFDPTTKTWSSRGDMPWRRTVEFVPLTDGTYLAFSGQNGLGINSTSTAFYDPTKDTWSAGPTAPINGLGRYFVPLSTGNLVLPNGSLWQYDQKARAFRAASNPTTMGLTVPLAGERLMICDWTTAACQIFAPFAAGSACNATTPGDCKSGYCVDGVCCDRACDGVCERCDLPGKVGTCTPLDGAPRTVSACAPFASCKAGACSATCNLDGDCVSSAYCAAGKCVAKTAQGGACTSFAQCATGRCVDGVCCGSLCDGQCEACNLPGKEGVCSAVTGTPTASRGACPGAGTECGGVCDGKTRATCVYLQAGVSPCGRNACAAGSETHASTCDGKGACADTPKSCGAYGCDVASCKSTCSSPADCAAGYLCVASACVPAPGLGDACATDAGCATGHCVDGACCGVASCGAGSTCAAPGKAGRCSKLAGVACKAADECGSAQCVDGVCCDVACSGACEACDLPGQIGTCSAVVGAPRGARAPCAGNATNCSLGVCDGKARATCAAKVSAEVSCRTASCANGKAIEAASCNGSGACPTLVEKGCGGFTCDATGTACRTYCTEATDCESGFVCRAGTCRPVAATCSLDGLSRIAVDGTVTACGAFRCRGGECVTSCGSSDACAPGHACADGACVLASNSTSSASSGGCSVRAPASASSPGDVSTGARLAGIGVLAALVGARRRHARRGRAKIAPRSLPSVLSLAALAALTALTAVACSVDHPAPTATRRAAIWADGAKHYWNLAMAVALPLPGGDLLLVGTEQPRYQRYLASSGTFIESGSPLTFAPLQRDQALAVIAGGKVLESGGGRNADMQSTNAEVYDPVADAWTPVASMAVARGQHALVGLADGRALAIGGLATVGMTSALSLVELYDPTTGTWSPRRPMTTARGRVAAVRLASGKVLAIGGVGLSTLSSAELYDPVADTWTTVGAMSTPRFDHATIVLPSGKVLVAGGNGRPEVWNPEVPLSSAELFDPTTLSWTKVGNLGDARIRPAVALLDAGRALVAGGAQKLRTTEVFDPLALVFSPAGLLRTDRVGGAAAPLSGGRALLAGGASYLDEDYSYQAEIWSPLGNGVACKADGECGSFACTDGVCCDVACRGACMACDVAGKLGTCSPISGAPRASHATCSPYATCSATTAGACAAACATDADCDATGYCAGTTCVARKGNAASCARNAECASGACADGVCCNQACDGACEACAETGSTGTCVAVTGKPRGARPACSGLGVYGTCGAQCLGVDRKACAYPSNVTPCSADACATGVETHRRVCDGVGRCGDVPKACGAFACAGATCRSDCVAAADCAAGFVCKSTKCVPAPGLGQPCDASSPCGAGQFCTDGVCCGVASCGAGSTCASRGRAGTCGKRDGEACSGEAECASGACVDGVCCESACAGQCQACAEPGQPGKCVAVKGAPRGARLACAKGATACEAASCDGADGSRCVALAGLETPCRAATCADGVAIAAAACAGKGTCPVETKTPCAPYRCDAAGIACQSACATSDDCANGWLCKAQACVRAANRCDADGVTIVDATDVRTSCAPFSCRDGACLEACAATTDCAAGFLCADGQCQSGASVGAGDTGSGGCAVGGPSTRDHAEGPTSVTTASIAALVCAALLARRRASAREGQAARGGRGTDAA